MYLGQDWNITLTTQVKWSTNNLLKTLMTSTTSYQIFQKIFFNIIWNHIYFHLTSKWLWFFSSAGEVPFLLLPNSQQCEETKHPFKKIFIQPINYFISYLSPFPLSYLLFTIFPFLSRCFRSFSSEQSSLLDSLGPCIALMAIF